MDQMENSLHQTVFLNTPESERIFPTACLKVLYLIFDVLRNESRLYPKQSVILESHCGHVNTANVALLLCSLC